MAIIKIFAEKDTSIYSEFPSLNVGIDEILEIDSYKDITGTAQVARTLIKFSTSDITNTLTLISSSQFDTYLRLFLATATELPTQYTIYCYPVSQSWEMGTGRFSNTPETRNGVSWASRSIDIRWDITGSTFYSTPFSSQSFVYNDSRDLEFKVTNILNAWTSSITNEGFLLKHSSSIEYVTGSNLVLKYFSRDTHTIYPPCLEFRWNDFLYSTGSLSTITSEDSIITLSNNKSEFQQDSIQKFRINARDKYPTRIFQTSSIYINQKILPTSSYWSIIDLDTEEIVVDYDTTYTKISCDSQGNYFTIYMNGLEPERFFKILIKTIINGNTIVFDKDYFFKVIR